MTAVASFRGRWARQRYWLALVCFLASTLRGKGAWAISFLTDSFTLMAHQIVANIGQTIGDLKRKAFSQRPSYKHGRGQPMANQTLGRWTQAPKPRTRGQTGLTLELLVNLIWERPPGTSPPGRKRDGKAANLVTIGVGDQHGRQFQDVEVTVDTGSTFTAVPRTLLRNLGVPVARWIAQSRMADGRTAPVDIGWTIIRLEGQTFPTRVIFAEEDHPSLLGVVALEDCPSGSGPSRSNSWFR